MENLPENWKKLENILENWKKLENILENWKKLDNLLDNLKRLQVRNLEKMTHNNLLLYVSNNK